ncbi:MAG: hypothetical protein JNK75_00245 [Betaproteobacteria bacterium]|nr:hypothetical protein [Betaproteobacteria bacterium]
MTYKSIPIALLTLLLTSCATAQRGALIKANKAIASQNYQECLHHLSSGETLGEYPEGIHAQVTFQKGICLEGLGRKAEAYALYRSLIARHPDSDWTAQAKARLDSVARPY